MNTALQAQGALGQQRILVVDADADSRAKTCRLIAGTRRLIADCTTSKEAIQRLAAHNVDLLVIEPCLPNINGIEILNWLSRNLVTVPVILISPEETAEAVVRAFHLGAFAYVCKASSENELPPAIERALGKRAMEQASAIKSAALEQSEQLHRYLVEQSPDLIYTLDHEGKFIFVNHRVESLLGYRRDELLGQHFSVIVHEDDLEQARYAFHERRIGERATSNFEVRLRNKQNGIQHFDNRMIVAILSSQGIYRHEESMPMPHFIGTSGVARDITERKRVEQMIAFQAFHDTLTGLPNRSLFMDRLDLAITQARRRNQRVGMMFLDIDRFKLINDTYGHAEGDVLLKEFAERTRNALRSGDTLARLGGDEFTVLLPDISNPEDVATIARKMLSDLKRPFVLAEQDFVATVSIGIAIYPDDGESPQDLIRNADIAMYQTKSQGKNGFLAFTGTMNASHVERLSLENDLRQALTAGDQFTLHFQPQFSLSPRRISGIEALIRWNHPTQGLIHPDAFIPLAEETGLIVPISDWVLDTACQQLTRLHQHGFTDLNLGINLSAKEFERDDLYERVASILAKNRLAPKYLEIEITENLLMKDVEAVIAKVRQLRRIGIRIAIGDFGIRYSSLNYLRRLSVSRVKIDHLFVCDIDSPHGSGAIIKAIVGVARSFGLGIIADGVETHAQQTFLSELGCTEMQGYNFCPPLTAIELKSYLGKPLRF